MRKAFANKKLRADLLLIGLLVLAAGLLYLFGGPLLSPMFAGAAMSLSSVCVVGNALRLGTAKL